MQPVHRTFADRGTWPDRSRNGRSVRDFRAAHPWPAIAHVALGNAGARRSPGIFERQAVAWRSSLAGFALGDVAGKTVVVWIVVVRPWGWTSTLVDTGLPKASSDA